MHLIYALTWFALAGFCVAGVILALRQKPGDERH
jgi:cytochrome oxidase assembly protein ShyY1